MPIEVRELVIKLVVEDGGARSNAATEVNSNAGGSVPNEELVNICVEKVFEILNEKNER